MAVTRNLDLPQHNYSSGAHYGELPLAALPEGDSTGDIFYFSGSNWTIRPLNSVTGSGSSAGMTNPMTDPGDMIYGGVAGNPTSLPIGLDDKVLTVVSGLPSWEEKSVAADQVTVVDADGNWIGTNAEAIFEEIADAIDAIVVGSGSGGISGTPLVVYPSIPMTLNSTATENGTDAGLLLPIVIPAPMRIIDLRVHTGTSAVGTNEWGLFDYSTDPTACVKLAGGQGALNGGNPSWSSIAAAGAPVIVPAGTYMLIFKLANANVPALRITAVTAGSGVKRIGTYTWDNTPDLTTSWADSSNLLHCYLRGEYTNGTNY